MKSILMSIQPYYAYLEMKGIKTVEMRKTEPKDKDWSRKVKVYVSQNKKSFNRIPKEDREWFTQYVGKVAYEFVCDYVEKEAVAFTEMGNLGRLYHCRLSLAELKKYAGKRTSLYYWHISALKVYDKPKELSDFNSIKQCKPEYSPFGYQWTWEDRHKRNTGGWGNKYRPVPIECHRCRCLVSGEDYLDEKSGCVLFDYECISKYHKPIERPPQSWQYVQELED